MLFNQNTTSQRFSDLLARVQRLEREHSNLLARIEGDAALRRTVTEFASGAHTASVMGAALEGFASAMRARLKRGRAGGIARARQAATLRERWSDGRYMAHEDSEQIEREIAEDEYMRYAAGGFARAASAARGRDGTFLPRSSV